MIYSVFSSSFFININIPLIFDKGDSDLSYWYPIIYVLNKKKMQSLRQRILNLTKKRYDQKKRCLSTQEIIERDDKYAARHFKPLPDVVLTKGEGVFLWDKDGKRYLDFLAGFSTINQGHSHPRLVKVMKEQAEKLAHTARAFYTEPHGELGEYLTKLIGYDRFIPMNTGKTNGGFCNIKLY